MLDVTLIRTQPDAVAAALAKRGVTVDFAPFLALDERRRALIGTGDAAKAVRNRISGEIPARKKAGEDVAPIFAEMKRLGADIAENDAQLAAVEAQIDEFLAGLPNLPDEDVVAGGKENNEVVRVFGHKPDFDFEPRNHVDLCTELGLIDYPRGVKLSGNGYWVYRGLGARMEWALLQYFIATHVADGYELVFVPHMLGYECGYTVGQFPKFLDEVYWIANEAGERRQFMLPTAETALVNLHRDEIVPEDELPKKYCAFTPCYRLEAGSYRSEERGMIRGHQFNKVEMVQFTRPEDSRAAHAELVAKAERLIDGLELHFRTSKLAAGDVSATMATTVDPEVWIPSMGIYKEVSSVSNARDYQARRGNMKFRRKETGRTEYMHTLNGSGLATSRLLPAIVEQHQQRDGSVRIPKVLQPYMGGLTTITKGGGA